MASVHARFSYRTYVIMRQKTWAPETLVKPKFCKDIDLKCIFCKERNENFVHKCKKKQKTNFTIYTFRGVIHLLFLRGHMKGGVLKQKVQILHLYTVYHVSWSIMVDGQISLMFYRVILWKCQFLSVPSLYRNITLEKHFRITILKLKNLLFEQLHLLEPSMWQCLFF